jgi:hypothetical protein
LANKIQEFAKIAIERSIWRNRINRVLHLVDLNWPNSINRD